jgi:predicted ATP-dependent endonuclease of OLD family
MIKELDIENFRGIRSLSLKGLKQFTVLAGKNNSGKSSVLDAVFIWANAAFVQNMPYANRLRGLENTPDSYRQFFYDTSYEKDICVSSVSTDGEKRTVVIHGIEHTPLSLESLLYHDDLRVAIDENGKKKEFLFKGDTADTRGEIVPNQYWSGIYDNNLAVKLTQIIVKKQKEAFISVLQAVDSSIRDFQMVNGNVIMFDIGKPQLVRYEIMGDGIKKILSLLASVSAAKGGVLLIDELENGLHYSSMDTLWRSLIKSAETNDVQIVATTHSYECMASFRKSLPETVLDKASIIRIERTNDVHTAVTMNSEDLKTMLDNNWEIR